MKLCVSCLFFINFISSIWMLDKYFDDDYFFFFYNDHDDSCYASWQVFLLWPAAACHSARLTSGSVRPPAASLCSPAGCWGPAGRSSRPSPAPPGPGLALGSQPWRHTVTTTRESWRRTADIRPVGAPRNRARSERETGREELVEEWRLYHPPPSAVSSTSGQIYCSTVQRDLWARVSVHQAVAT